MASRNGVCEYAGGVHPRHGRFEEVTAIATIQIDRSRGGMVATRRRRANRTGGGVSSTGAHPASKPAPARGSGRCRHEGQMGRVGASTPLRLKAHSERSFSGSKSDLPIRGVECTADVAPAWLRNRCAAIFQPCATAVSRRIGATASATTTEAPVGRQVRRLPINGRFVATRRGRLTSRSKKQE